MSPEGKVKARIRLRLSKCPVPVYLFMPVQNGMGDATLDFLGCIGGLFFAIEAKAGYGSMTPRQQSTAARMRLAGATVFLLNEDPMRWDAFEDWLTRATAIVALTDDPVPTIPPWAANLLINEQESGDGSSTES